MRNRLVLQTIVVCLVLVVACLCFSAGAQSAKEKQKSPPESDLAARIERVENGLLPPAVLKGEAPARMSLADRMKFYKTPGVSIAVINGGRIEWACGYSVLEAGGKEPVTPETLFQAASNSKSLTAMVALRLVELGKLDLDSDVNKWLVSWKVPENEFTKDQKVTVRRLLSRTAGVSNPGFLGYPVDKPLPTLRQILDGEKPANSSVKFLLCDTTQLQSDDCDLNQSFAAGGTTDNDQCCGCNLSHSARSRKLPSVTT